MAQPKTGEKNGEPFHYSVGAFIKRDGKYFLIDRKNPPYGFAAVAGHIDLDEKPQVALVREVKEESGLDVTSYALLFKEFIRDNECVHGIKSHQWYVYEVETSGEVVYDKGEAKSAGWYTEEEVEKLPLERVWKYWFERLNNHTHIKNESH